MTVELTYDDFRAARLVNAVAGIALTLVDYLETFPKEVRLIWPTRMSICKALFFAVRYGTLVLAVLVYICELSPTFQGEDCEKIFTATSVLEVVLSLLGEAIVYIRVWAFSGCDRRVLYYLIAQYLAMFGSGFYLLTRFVVSAKVASGAPLTGFSCIFHYGDSMCIAIVYGILLASVIALMCVMVVIAAYRYNGAPVSSTKNGLFAQFYKDGVVYFLMLGGLCIANIASIVIGRRGFLVEYVHSLVTGSGMEHTNFGCLTSRLQIYLHSIISTRMILHLREYAGQAGEVEGHSVIADSSIKNQDLVGASPMGILKAVIPRFGVNRIGKEGVENVSGMKFASVNLSANGEHSVV
ncbi:hypothetical protein DFP72DRAFT_904950 [Ephemerocybe angulata]|uniref:DUF6533 domain-containing protein n=1 Tax=Ephemerocybe angulata TaxID=980116 RepID=A0A8H6HTF2_9AGAR|nr:hypothetical protein DFP72DRAFT_904950 [Tulosesus angulatus]